jgi:hypothetical protein
MELAGDVTGLFPEHALDDRVDVFFLSVSQAVFGNPGLHGIQAGKDGLDLCARHDFGPT